MKKILELVSSTFTDEEIKQIIEDFYNNKANSIYEYFRNQVQEKEYKKSEDYNEFLINLFKEYIEKIKEVREKCPENNNIKLDYEIINDMDISNIKTIENLFASHKFKRLINKPIWPQSGNEKSKFIHIIGNCLDSSNFENSECRLYLCPEFENIISIVGEIISSHNEIGFPCHLKINTSSSDNDRIVLYSSLDNAFKHIELIEKVKHEHKELFINMGKNKLWGNIENVDGIYFGMEPFLFDCNSSYGSIRASIIEEALLDFFYKYDNYEKNQPITEEMLEYFKSKLRLHSLANNVNPDNFCLNMTKEKKSRTPIRLNNEFEKSVSVIVNYVHPNSNMVTISCPKYYRDDNTLLTISMEELELIYEHDITDQKYNDSKRVRKEVYTKLQKLHRQNKIDSVLQKIRYRDKMMTQQSFGGRTSTNKGWINYNLYRVLPSKVSDLLCLIRSRSDNRKKGIVDVKTTEQISKLVDDISNNDPLEVKAVMTVIKEEILNKEGNNYIESIKKR